MSFHPDCTLRSQKLEVHLAYDGSVHVASVADVLDPQGLPTNHMHTHATRFAPNEWHDLSLREMCRVAHHNHHRFLGLAVPADDDAPLHLHPKGHPAYAPNTVPGHRAPHDPSALRDHILAQREAEVRGRERQNTGRTSYRLKPHEHPLSAEIAARTPTPIPAPHRTANPVINPFRRS